MLFRSESVKRHFREMGIDTQRQDFTVAGIGDMSGDVFGNAMLLSNNLRLRAAFNHWHVFLDPNPDPSVSFAERQRLVGQVSNKGARSIRRAMRFLVAADLYNPFGRAQQPGKDSQQRGLTGAVVADEDAVVARVRGDGVGDARAVADAHEAVHAILGGLVRADAVIAALDGADVFKHHVAAVAVDVEAVVIHVRRSDVADDEVRLARQLQLLQQRLQAIRRRGWVVLRQRLRRRDHHHALRLQRHRRHGDALVGGGRAPRPELPGRRRADQQRPRRERPSDPDSAAERHADLSWQSGRHELVSAALTWEHLSYGSGETLAKTAAGYDHAARSANLARFGRAVRQMLDAVS